MAEDNQRGDPAAYWRANLRLIAVLLAVWALVSYVLGILLVEPLNSLHIGSLPLGFWLALPYGIGAVAAVWALLFPVIAAAILLRTILRAVGLSLVSYLRVLRTPALASLAMALTLVGLAALTDLPMAWLLVVKIVVGAAIYASLVTLLEGNPYHEFRRLLMDTRAGARA